MPLFFGNYSDTAKTDSGTSTIRTNLYLAGFSSLRKISFIRDISFYAAADNISYYNYSDFNKYTYILNGARGGIGYIIHFGTYLQIEPLVGAGYMRTYINDGELYGFDTFYPQDIHKIYNNLYLDTSVYMHLCLGRYSLFTGAAYKHVFYTNDPLKTVIFEFGAGLRIF